MASPKQEKRESSRDGIAGKTSVFSGKRALVAGGSGGIGRAICELLATRGCSVIVHGRDPEKVDRFVGELGSSARGFALDIKSPSAFLKKAAEYGEVDILVVAFGPFVHKPLSSHTSEEWEQLALLDLALPGAAASFYLPGMRARGWGRILLFGGTRTDSIRGFSSNAAYAAAKTGVGVVAKSIALEYAGENVAAVAVCPGLVETEYQSASTKRSMKSMAPGGKLLTPERVARAALDLLDADHCLASGAVVSLDAGFDPGRSKGAV